ncbi:hypothetical protein [Bradyrhizobium sp. AZCC 1699]|uniref:hypothetical protein n=1 Tax=Bradyrhizobium sp. AZCC 1699 TaxID=3117024 RepID=UPI002FEFE10B
MRRFLLLSVLLLGGCAVQSAYEPPVVDMAGVDQNRYNQDLSECTRKKMDQGAITFGAVISNCMRERGYRVIAAKS